MDDNLPFEIALSDGTIINAPDSLIANVKQFQSIQQMSPNQNNKLILFENKIIKQRNAWFYQVASDLLKKYNTIIFEHQNRYPGNNIQNAGWIQFIGELYKQSQTDLNKHKLIGLNKDFRTMNTCAFCGYEDTHADPSILNWNCPRCYVPLKTNVNAARNILKAGLKKI